MTERTVHTAIRLSAAEARNTGILKPKKRAKYGAKRMYVDGVWFDSIAEAKFYGGLRDRQKAGEVGAILRQPEFPLVVNGIVIAKYRADFQFFDRIAGHDRTVDVKGFDTPLSRLKRKHVKAQYGIDVEVVK